MRVAVTACTGRLGRALLEHLGDEPSVTELVGVARDPSAVEAPGVEPRAGDYQSHKDVRRALDGVDSVILISAPVTPGTDRVAMHRNVINAAAAAGVRRCVYTSIIGNGDEAGTLYAPTQEVNRQTERDLAASGLESVVARNGLYLELDLGHIIKANDAGVYSNNGGDGRCGYLTIDELAFAIARLAFGDLHAGRTYNVIGELTTQAEMVAMANDVFGLNVKYRTISDEENIERFMADPRIAARGREVAEMLTGCFQCIRKGAFDVPSQFAEAAGRPAKSMRDMMVEIRDR